MGILAGIGNIYFVYQFLKKLVTPFEKTKAFELGIIDEKGKILKRRRDLDTSEEKDAYNLSDTLIWNIKKLMGKIPGGKSRIASYAAALWLIKEQQDGYKITEEELELQFFDMFEKMYNNDLKFDSRTLKKFGGIDVFAIDPTYFQKSRLGKKKYTRYSGYVGEDEAGEYIRAFARKYPKKPIIVMDSDTGCMQFLRHGFGK